MHIEVNGYECRSCGHAEVDEYSTPDDSGPCGRCDGPTEPAMITDCPAGPDGECSDDLHHFGSGKHVNTELDS